MIMTQTAVNRRNQSNLAKRGMIMVFAAGMMLSTVGCSASPKKDIELGNLRCEYLVNPLGIDAATPRLSWTLQSGRRGVLQKAYQILVASSPELLAKDQGDLWDSGQVASDQSIQVPYKGKALTSKQYCHWKVRVWGPSDAPCDWSQPALWSMGLLNADNWRAKWIGYDVGRDIEPPPYARVAGCQWVGDQAGEARVTDPTRYLRKEFILPADRKVKTAILTLLPDQACSAAINGKPVGQAFRWEQTANLDVSGQLRAGQNAITLTVSHFDFLPPKVAGRLTVMFDAGDPLTIPVDKSWKIAKQLPAGHWQEVGFDDRAWPQAQEFGPGTPWGTNILNDLDLKPAPYLRKTFHVAKPVKRAVIHSTALGVYELHLNGSRVGKDYLTPGWTDYRKRVDYNTYDVTVQVQQGDNAFGAILGEGWYAGCIGFVVQRGYYGKNPRLRAQLELTYADGTTECIATDETWKGSFGPIHHGDLLQGCSYDSRLEMPGWDKAQFDDRAWSPVTAKAAAIMYVADVTAKVAAAVKDNRLSVQASNKVFGDPAYLQVKQLKVTYTLGTQSETRTVPEDSVLNIPDQGEPAGQALKIVRAEYGPANPNTGMLIQAAMAEPVAKTAELPARKLTEPRPGAYTFDLGQNMVGWVRLKVNGRPGQKITVRHGEMLNADGSIYTANLRGAAAVDTYILRGGEQTLEPYFTFHGFQYVEVTGLTAKPTLDAVTGIAVNSDIRRTGQFECSNPLVNRLFSNIIWGQKGNYLEVPTDCPQRDERAGWTGDAQFFIRTGSYNFDVAAFFSRWLVTLCQDSQHADKTFAPVAPDLGGGPSVAWGDAALICPYRIFRVYGDTRVIERNWEAMTGYMQFAASHTKDFVTSIGGFGDWLNLGGDAKKEVIDTAYYGYLASIMAEMAAAIGKPDHAKHYLDLAGRIKESFARNFILPDGSIKESSQTGYALALSMDLVPADMRDKVAQKLVDDIKGRNWHLATGFIGTPRLLPALQMAGRNDVAYRLLMQDTYPSWLFQVKLGATTMWERWDGWTPDRGFQSIGMNSFNHYAFGAVGEYLYSGVAGIDAQTPAYKKIIIRPCPGGGLTWAKATYDSIHGPIVSSWKADGDKFTLHTAIPANTTATVYVPAGDASTVTESGKAADKASGVKFLRFENNVAIYLVGSGTYDFASTLPKE